MLYTMEGKLLHLVVILSVCIPVLHACAHGPNHVRDGYWTICGTINNLRGICKPEDSPYKPGGNTVHLEPIEAPVATIQESGLANMGKYAGLGVGVTESILDVAEAAEKGFEAGKKLAAHLSVWGTVFGALATTMSPSAQDILDSVNKAFADLTEDINNAFVSMQGYVDQQILDSQKERWDDRFSLYYTTFTQCLDLHIVGEEYVNECMEGVEQSSRADKNVFMDYWTYMDTPWEPTNNDIRHIEVQFLVFRDYANLRIMILLTLINTYQNLTDDYHQNMNQLYYNYLVKESEEYIEYAQFCYGVIKDGYLTDGNHFNNSLTCDSYQPICEGWGAGVHTASKKECSMQFSRMLLDNEFCEATTMIRYDGSRPPKCVCNPHPSGDCNDEDCALLIMAEKEMEPLYNDFNNKMQLQIKNYWEPSVMNSLPKLQEIHDEAKKVVDEKYPSRSATPQDEYMTKGRKKHIDILQNKIKQRKLDRMENHAHQEKTKKKSEL